MKPWARKLLVEVGTPALTDKRMWHATWVEAAIFAGIYLRIIPPEIGVPAVVGLALGYMGASAAGLVMRTKALASQAGALYTGQEEQADNKK